MEMEEEVEAVPPLSEAAPLKQAQVPVARPLNLSQTYEWEFVALAGVLVYIAAFFVGGRMNQTLANAWFDEFAGVGKLIPSHFAATGLNADPDSKFLKETANRFRFYASGRVKTRGMVVSLDLVPRQDLLSWVSSWLVGEEDTVTVEIFMEPTEMSSFVFAVVPKNRRRRVQREARDLAAFSSVIGARKLPAGMSSLSVLTDSDELVSRLLTDSVARLLSKHAPPLPKNRWVNPDAAPSTPAASADDEGSSDPLFRMLHVTDRVPYYDRGVHVLSSHAVRFQFKLPKAGHMDELADLMNLVISFTDKVGSTPLSAETSKKNAAMRTRLDKLEQENQEEGEGSDNKQLDAMVAKREQLRKLKLTDPAEYRKQQKRMEDKYFRKRTKTVSSGK
jgi:hypothetical protein